MADWKCKRCYSGWKPLGPTGVGQLVRAHRSACTSLSKYRSRFLDEDADKPFSHPRSSHPIIIVPNHWVHQMKVNFYSSLRRIVRQKTVEIPLPETATVRQLLEELKLRYPQAYDEFVDQNGHLYPHAHLFINGRDIPYLNGLDTRLSDQDNVDIFPPGHF